MLISGKLVRDRMVTCWPSIATDINNAGGLYMDKPVVEDGNLITSRKIDDVPHYVSASFSVSFQDGYDPSVLSEGANSARCISARAQRRSSRLALRSA